MYSFSRKSIGPYTVHISTQKRGDTHHKKFSGKVTPSSQNTTNIYVSGRFQLSAGDYSQELIAGQTNLDLNIHEYIPDQVLTETVLSDYAVRYCVPSAGLTRTIVEVEQPETYNTTKNSLIFVLAGKAVVSGTSISLGGYWLVQNTQSISGPVKLLVLSSKIDT